MSKKTASMHTSLTQEQMDILTSKSTVIIAARGEKCKSTRSLCACGFDEWVKMTMLLFQVDIADLKVDRRGSSDSTKLDHHEIVCPTIGAVNVYLQVSHICAICATLSVCVPLSLYVDCPCLMVGRLWAVLWFVLSSVRPFVLCPHLNNGAL